MEAFRIRVKINLEEARHPVQDPSMGRGIHRRLATGAGAVCLSAALLWWVFGRVDPDQFRQAFADARPERLALAFLLTGTSFLFAAWRWHLMLRISGNAVHPAATLRGVLLGHAAHQFLFGAAGGDWAKSALYARRYGLRTSSVWASAPLDRLAALAGAVSFGLLMVLLGAAAGGFHPGVASQLALPLGWFLAVLALVPAGLLLFRRWERRPASRLHAFAATLLQGGRVLLRDRRIMAKALLGAFCVHACLGLSMALCLSAVAGEGIRWPALMWIFPVISLVAGLPVAAGGAGLREGSALLLLGLYGIPAAEAVAAALCLWGIQILWCLLGLWIWWLGGRGARPGPPPRTVSAVIPTWNEQEALGATLDALGRIPEVSEVLVADGGSSDATLAIARERGCRVLLSRRGRGVQMREAARHASGDVVWLLHADTVPSPACGRAMLAAFRDRRVVGGGFWKSFDRPSAWMAGSRFRCLLRMLWGRRALGDQGLFVLRSVLERVGGVPALPLMEEFELCRRMRREGRLALADAEVVASARRFREHGVLRVYLLMGIVMLRYRLGTPIPRLAEIYSACREGRR